MEFEILLHANNNDNVNKELVLKTSKYNTTGK